MSERVILNPSPLWDAGLQDSMCPDYGFTRKRATTRSLKKAVGGTPYTREIGNTGHTFTLSWLSRSWACVQRLKWFYEQFEDGFFTIIDWDGGGRHYVGRFTTEVAPVETGNGKWDVQNVTFEELPQVPMLDYPNDWDHDAIWHFAVNDFGDQKVAVQGAWTQTARSYSGVTRYTMDNPGTNAGDWAQYEYRGYGFELHMLEGPEFGQCDVYLDGTLLQTLDLYNAAEMGPQMVLRKVNVPLDLHRVKVITKNAKNANATGTNISWYGLRVMR
jgi:hypothetical protein